ncbi:MAG: hypothetical protein AAF729_07375 [Pseudomonadota bacterium]
MSMMTDNFNKSQQMSNFPDPSETMQGLAKRAQIFVGGALFAAAFALWLAPGATWAAEVIGTKVVLSMILGFIGLGLVQSGFTPTRREIEIDSEAGEIRVMRYQGKQAKVLRRCAFEDLGSVHRDGTVIRIWDASGAFIADIGLEDVQTSRDLADALAAAGEC